MMVPVKDTEESHNYVPLDQLGCQERSGADSSGSQDHVNIGAKPHVFFITQFPLILVDVPAEENHGIVSPKPD